MVFQTQVPISLVILVIGIQDLYISKYKNTIIINIIIVSVLSATTGMLLHACMITIKAHALL